MNNISTTLGSTFAIGAAAIGQGVEHSTRAAMEVADATTARPVEQAAKIEEPFIQLKQSEYEVAAGAKIVQAADRQLGTLINIKA